MTASGGVLKEGLRAEETVVVEDSVPVGLGNSGLPLVDDGPATKSVAEGFQPKDLQASVRGLNASLQPSSVEVRVDCNDCNGPQVGCNACNGPQVGFNACNGPQVTCIDCNGPQGGAKEVQL